MVAELAPVRSTNNPNGRPSNATLVARNITLRQHNAELRRETAIILEEVAKLGRRLISLGTTLEYGFLSERDDLVDFVRSDIQRLGASCLRKAGEA